MKTIISILAIVALMSSCKKTETTPTTLVAGPPPINLKTVKVVINKGGLDQFTNITWSWDPYVDSAYHSSNNGYIRTYINTTSSDSIHIYSESNPLGPSTFPSTDQITVYVNGVLKTTYSGMHIAKKVYLN
jgi:hypothetical protein